MDEVTQQNAALVEEAAAAAESLEEQAHNLAQAVSVFALSQNKDMRNPSPPSREQRASVQASVMAALPHKEPIRLKGRTLKSDIKVSESYGNDEWAEF